MKSPSKKSQEVSMVLDTEQQCFVLRQINLGRTISEIAGGLLHTPTCTANFTAQSMQKHPACRRYVKIFGNGPIIPEHFELLMGVPIGWTDCDVLGTAKTLTPPFLLEELYK